MGVACRRQLFRAYFFQRIADGTLLASRERKAVHDFLRSRQASGKSQPARRAEFISS
ncbi:hypothetical protein N234_34425 [Ralstonia pickettii DTP0602]|nr:hypothetical protein N234_34425 [Ralstonia pickettii DTP0602]